MRLIDADALKETIVSNVYPVVDDFNNCDYGMFWTGGIEKAIDEQPTIEERKTGEWIEREVCDEPKVIEEWQSAQCSNCGLYHTTPYMYYFDNYKYCPNCGARMVDENEIN